MPIYEHECQDCKKIISYLYSIKKDPKELICENCGSTNTVRLISKIHIGWERRMLNTFIKADDERAEAMQKDHMGPTGGYTPLPDEIND